MRNCAILDIGKTHVKLAVVNDNYEMLVSEQRRNKVLLGGLYPHVAVNDIWNWFVNQLTEFAAQYPISTINVSTHGATAALVHEPTQDNTSGLVLPILDYEWDGVESVTDYQTIRPPFNETFSPKLPVGLNLGRQLFWLAENYPEQFANAEAILLYPQYWVWRMTGKMLTEVTSLGCHTDLWDVEKKDYSSLVTSQNWAKKFPALHSAMEPVAQGTQDFIEQTGIEKNCLIYSGLHDSNASYLRYMNAAGDVNKTIISTGTWTISFSQATTLNKLSEARDMLLNVDIHSRSVACARFMGGREFENICQQLNTPLKTIISETDIQQLLDDNVMALPDFSGGSGPFAGRQSEIIGTAKNDVALATLYIALMMHYDLELLDNHNDVVIGGAFTQNILLCRILAQLRSEQNIALCSDTTEVISGAASLCFASSYDKLAKHHETNCSPTSLKGLNAYAKQCKTSAGSEV